MAYFEKVKRDLKELINRLKQISIELISIALEPTRQIIERKYYTLKLNLKNQWRAKDTMTSNKTQWARNCKF